MSTLNVDRRRFLELVTAIACAHAAACATTPPEPQVVVAPLDIKPIAEMSKPIATSAPVDPGTPPPSAVPPSMSAGIWGLPYDSAAPPKACAQLRCPGPTQEAMGALRSQCRALSETLRPEPFQRFMTCMMSVNNTVSTCDLTLIGTEPGECLEKWSEPPTIDPATAAKCKPIVAACAGPNRSVYADKPISMEACQRIFSVTLPRAERKMIHCVTEYCDGAQGLCYMATMY